MTSVHLFSSYQKKELTTNAPPFPHSSSILIISFRAGLLLPGPFPPSRAGLLLPGLFLPYRAGLLLPGLFLPYQAGLLLPGPFLPCRAGLLLPSACRADPTRYALIAA